MKLKRNPMRYAHTNGHTSCIYAFSDNKIITCGSDGDIRIWESVEDDDPHSKCLGEFVTAICQFKDKLLAANDLNVVDCYTYPDIERDGTDVRFTAQGTCITSNEKFIAVGSEDTNIKVYPKGESKLEFDLEGHKGPILSLALNKDNLLASAAGDGTIKIWNVDEKKEVKTIAEDIPKCNSFEVVKFYGSPTFTPNGKSMAYTNGKKIIVLNVETWGEQSTFSVEDSSLTCCSISVDGQFIAAGSEAGHVYVWNLSNKALHNASVQAHEELYPITAIAWNPKDSNEFAYCDASGQLGTVVMESGEEINGLVDDEAGEDLMDFHEGDFGDGDVDDDDDGGAVSLEKLKNDIMHTNGLHNDEDTRDSMKSSVARDRSKSPERIHYKEYKMQSAFQPSSTPSDLENRYLLWNEVGLVKSYTSGDESSINVEFHDVATHHNLHVNNYLQHTMASLSSSVLALSSENSTKIVCILLTSTLGNKEWTVALPDCEGVVALTATTKYIAVGTDNRFIRFYSVMGTQREVISVPGPIVCMAGYKDKIMVAYHSAAANEDQHISIMFIQIFGLNIKCREARLPLPPGRTLSWMGYSIDCGTPIFYDNMGLLQMYSMKGNCWYPMCDTTKHSQSVSNNYFIVDVCEKQQIAHAILCRATRYPMTHPRPMVAELPLQMPLSEMDTERSTLEDSLLRNSIFQTDNSEKHIKESAIKLFAMDCRAEKEAKAKELVEMIANPGILELAIKYAGKLGRIHFADRLAEMMPALQEKETEREKEMEEMEKDAFQILQNSSSLLLMQGCNTPKAESGVKIAPKPMVLSNQKRNPFKRSQNASPQVGSSSPNPFSHLMDKVIEVKPSQDSVEGSQEVIPDSQNIENITPKRTFVSWFQENKAALQTKHPKATPTELTKLGMTEFRSLSATEKSTKRKIDSDVPGNNMKQAKIDFGQK